MGTFFRHTLSIALLPFTVTVVVPVYLGLRAGLSPGVAEDWPLRVAQLLGLGSVGVGATLFLDSVARFASEGRGTLAPWDPPERLVVTGYYRYVRNPMISGVVFVLLGEALLLLSRPHFAWAGFFILANLVMIPLFEEPQLERRFGEPYREYCRHVPRLVPRLRPWTPSGEGRGDSLGGAARHGS